MSKEANITMKDSGVGIDRAEGFVSPGSEFSATEDEAKEYEKLGWATRVKGKGSTPKEKPKKRNADAVYEAAVMDAPSREDERASDRPDKETFTTEEMTKRLERMRYDDLIDFARESGLRDPVKGGKRKKKVYIIEDLLPVLVEKQERGERVFD